MKRIKYLFPLALVAFVSACGECEGGWRSYDSHIWDYTIEQWTSEGRLDFSDGLDIYECDLLCQPGGIDDFRGCSDYRPAGYYSGSAPPGNEIFVPEWAGGASGRDPESPAFIFGEKYHSITCTYFVRNTCGQIFPPP